MGQNQSMNANTSSRNTSQITRRLSEINHGSSAIKESQPKDIIIRPVLDSYEMEDVYRLTHDAYVERGYCTPQSDRRLIHYPHLDRINETTVLIAISQGNMVGTNSITLDSTHGLHVDEDFKVECDAIRKEGRKMAGSWRIATHLSCRQERQVMINLIRCTIHWCIDASVETCVFTFNPRHERFYQKILNIKTISRKESVGALQNAPAVFMRLDIEDCPEHWMQ
jgi:hypothetical protein